MNVRHFVKTLIIFVGMILLGLLGVYLINYFDQSGNSKEILPEKAEVAK